MKIELDEPVIDEAEDKIIVRFPIAGEEQIEYIWATPEETLKTEITDALRDTPLAKQLDAHALSTSFISTYPPAQVGPRGEAPCRPRWPGSSCSRTRASA